MDLATHIFFEMNFFNQVCMKKFMPRAKFKLLNERKHTNDYHLYQQDFRSGFY